MKILMTGGGTAGHVTPNIALIEELKSKNHSISYIGTELGVEKTLIEGTHIPYNTITAGKLRRYLDIENITDIFKILKGFAQSYSHIKKIKPDIVFSKGGFVSCPVVWAARLNRIPVVIHESDMTPGLANKLSIPFSNQICYTFSETAKHLPSNKSTLTGLPVRKNLLNGIKEKGLQLCEFDSKEPIIVVIGGSLGSKKINDAIRKSSLIPSGKYQICHICGKGMIDNTLLGCKHYKQFEYIDEDLANIFAMADIVISRAGATTIFELLHLNIPNILIPLSKASSRGDQILNANYFKNQGYSEVIEEEFLTTSTLERTIRSTLNNKNNYKNAMARSSLRNGAEIILGVIEQNAKQHSV